MARIRTDAWDKIRPHVEEESDRWRFLDAVDRPVIIGFVIGVLDRIKSDSDVAEALANDLYEGVGHGV